MDKSRLDKLGGRYLPKGHNLDVDRRQTSKIVYDPNDKKEYKAWSKKTNKTDLDGYDTKKQEKTIDRRKLTKALKQSRRSVAGRYIVDDPDRFVAEGYETRKLIDQVADKIFDYKSMKEQIKNAWGGNDSLVNIWKTRDWITEEDWKALFETAHIKNIITNNTITPIIKQIQKKYNVDAIKAKQIYDRLTPKQKSNLLKKIGKREKIKRKIRIVKKKTFVDLIPKAKRQKSKLGNYYVRTKPQRFNKLQLTFLNNYKNEKVSTILKVYNNTFKEKRTESSLKNKLYRLKKVTK